MPRLSFRHAAGRGLVAAAVTAGAGATVGLTSEVGEAGTPAASAAASSVPAPVHVGAAGGRHVVVVPKPKPKPKPKHRRATRSTARRPLAPRTIAKVLLAKRGWSGQFGCLDALWTRESNWRVNADNPSSSAYGIPQALPGSKMASAGRDWRTNPATQIRWGLRYIASSYGSPCAAWSHSKAYGYY